MCVQINVKRQTVPALLVSSKHPAFNDKHILLPAVLYLCAILKLIDEH